MIAKRIINALKKKFSHATPPLGRWNNHNYKQTSLKIKYANEDNCGTCGDYTSTQEIQYEPLEKLYVYMMGIDTVPDVKQKR
jgi:hypothetical protein